MPKTSIKAKKYTYFTKSVTGSDVHITYKEDDIVILISRIREKNLGKKDGISIKQ